MLKRLSIRQECARFFIQEHQLLHAILRGDEMNIIVFTKVLAHYDENQREMHWTELYDAYQKVKGKEEGGKIHKEEGVKR